MTALINFLPVHYITLIIEMISVRDLRPKLNGRYSKTKYEIFIKRFENSPKNCVTFYIII